MAPLVLAEPHYHFDGGEVDDDQHELARLLLLGGRVPTGNFVVVLGQAGAPFKVPAGLDDGGDEFECGVSLRAGDLAEEDVAEAALQAGQPGVVLAEASLGEAPDDGPDGVAQLELVGVGGGDKVFAELGHDGVEVLVAWVAIQ